jgi:hypothetical protein
MTTKTIDIPLPPELEELLKQPVCVPLPEPGKAQITLPTGGTIKGLVDVTKGIPDDCSLTFSLVLPMLTFLGNFECLFKILKLIQPLIDVVKGLGPPPDPIKLGSAIPNFLKAAEELTPCLLVPTPAAMVPFVRDLLCLVIKLLNCIVGLLKSITGVLGGLALQIQSAQAAGNTELLAALECSQKNAQTSVQHVFSALDPILLLLSLAEPFLGIAGVNPIKIPALASPDDLEKMQDTVNTLEELVKTLQLAAKAVGGC